MRLIALLFLWVLSQSGIATSVSGGCQMAYMAPHYIHVNGFNSDHSRLASKYALHMYREAGWDLEPVKGMMTGIPVLFIPGNAGSYRQIRSIAAAAARAFYEAPGQPKADMLAQGARSLDFFAADFNEDFSAFHGATLEEQTEYVCDALRFLLALYKQSSHPDAKMTASVILVAHSMGGMVARSVFQHPNYPAGSVNTIVTLSTPHYQPPAPFSRQIERLYASTNTYWQDSFAQKNHPLRDVAILSIVGGTADTMIDSDSAHLSGIAPTSNALSVFTTTVPDLYTSVDHLAIMWCNQLRHKIAASLLDLVDVSRPTRTKSVPERLAVWRRTFLSGLEDEVLSLAPRNFSSSVQGPISHALHLDAGTYSSISSQPLILQACATCSNQTLDSHPIPPSHLGRGTSNEDPPFFVSVISPTDSNSVLSFVGRQSSDFVAVQVAPAKQSYAWTLLGTMLFLHEITVDAHESLGKEISFPFLDSSLVAYSVEVALRSCEAQSKFAPMLQASTTQWHELHYFPNLKSASVHLHGKAPFQPSNVTNGLSFRLWFDAACAEPLVLKMQLDLSKTTGIMLRRHRLLLASWPSAVVLTAISRVRLHPDTHAALVPALWKASRSVFIRQGAALTAIAVLQSYLCSARPSVGDLWLVRDLLLGNHEPLFVPLVPIFYALCILATLGAAAILHAALSLLTCTKKWLAASVSSASSKASPSLLSIVAIYAFVLFFAPYQFALLVIALLALVSTPTALVDQYLLLLLLLLLPANGPVLIVWVRNLAAGWWQPFSSDHNALMMTGYLLWFCFDVRMDVKGPTLDATSLYTKLNAYAPLVTAAATLLYGLRYTFVISELVNVLLVIAALPHLRRLLQ